MNYDLQNWQLLKSQLDKDFNSIHILNRGQIVHDSFNLARKGFLPYDTAFGISNFVRNDDEYTVWQNFRDVVADLKNILVTTPTYGKFKVIIIIFILFVLFLGMINVA